MRSSSFHVRNKHMYKAHQTRSNRVWFILLYYPKYQHSIKSPCTIYQCHCIQTERLVVSSHPLLFFFNWEVSQISSHTVHEVAQKYTEKVNTRMVQHSVLPRQHPLSLCSVSSSLYLQGVTFSECEMLSECITLIQSNKKYFCSSSKLYPPRISLPDTKCWCRQQQLI